MTVIEKKLSEIHPYENNPRKIEKGIPKVAESIREFGFKVPLVIDRDGVIVCGHTRYAAAKLLGMDTVPCIVADDLTDEQTAEFRIVDNKTGELAKWDIAKLREELEAVEGIDMQQFGFFVKEITSYEKETKEKPEPKEIRCPRCGKVVARK